jgi:cobalt/nickel transport system permease protein
MFAMHAPDGFLGPWVAVATGGISLLVLWFAVRSASREMGDRQVPLAGIAAAFVFAGQMLNFPVASGTSGHLIGAALVAILLGPSLAALVVTVVVVVQALVFADGGITALGVNVLNMAIVPAFGGWALFWAFRRVLPVRSGGVVGATALASGLTVVLAAMAFSLEWLFGATAPIPFDTVFGAMVGVHVLIGIGEATISALVVAAVLAVRPDLVAGARDLSPDQLSAPIRVGAKPFAIAGVLVALLLAVGVSQFASSAPDGLERVAADHGIADRAGEHTFADGVLADYATSGIDNETLSLAIAGAAGVTITLVVGFGLISALRRTRSPSVAR